MPAYRLLLKSNDHSESVRECQPNIKTLRGAMRHSGQYSGEVVNGTIEVQQSAGGGWVTLRILGVTRSACSGWQ